MKKRIISYFFLFTFLPVFTQSKLVRHTYNITDTTKSKIEQAKDIYTWIVTNIEYDTRQLEKDKKKYTPVETLKRKKAVCYGYSELFNELCRIVDIESYVIIGYCKGFDYESGDHFIKSNHAWNIIHIDTSWIIVDATWGSGGLSYDYSFREKIKKALGKKKGMKTDIEFVLEPSYDYFNITPMNLIKTHFPLDAKWQLMKHPVSYYAFIADSVDTSMYINCEREISKVRNKGMNQQIFMDALNSIKYSPFNRYDIAYQYYNQANQFTISKKTVYDSTLIEPLELAISYYDSSLVYLKDFKTHVRYIYKLKKVDIKTAYKKGKNTIKVIRKIPTMENGKYDKAYGRLLKYEALLKKEELRANQPDPVLAEEVAYSYDTVNSYDTLVYGNNITKLSELLTELQKQHAQLDKSVNILQRKYESGMYLDNEILYQLQNSKRHLQDVDTFITSMNVYKVFDACLKFASEYSEYTKVYTVKADLRIALIEEYNWYLSGYEKTMRTYTSILYYYESLARLTGNNKYYSIKANYILERAKALFSQKLEVISYIKQHNDSWMDFLSRQDMTLKELGANGMVSINSRLTDFYNYAVDKKEKAYTSNIKLYENIRSDCKSRKKYLKGIMKIVKKNEALLAKNQES